MHDWDTHNNMSERKHPGLRSLSQILSVSAVLRNCTAGCKLNFISFILNLFEKCEEFLFLLKNIKRCSLESVESTCRQLPGAARGHGEYRARRLPVRRRRCGRRRRRRFAAASPHGVPSPLPQAPALDLPCSTNTLPSRGTFSSITH